jgi:hypothetical protein
MMLMAAINVALAEQEQYIATASIVEIIVFQIPYATITSGAQVVAAQTRPILLHQQLFCASDFLIPNSLQ